MTNRNQVTLDFEFDSLTRKAILIGQAPPKKKDSIPFKKTRLYRWFSEINISQSEVVNMIEFEALIDFFPGSDKKGDNKPMATDIERHIPTILHKIESHNMTLVIPVGKMAIEHVLNVEGIKLADYVGKSFNCPPFQANGKSIDIVPLPHPSGLSTWVFKEGHSALLKKALQHIKNHLK